MNRIVNLHEMEGGEGNRNEGKDGRNREIVGNEVNKGKVQYVQYQKRR